MTDKFLLAHESSEQARLDFVEAIPLKRLGAVSDVAYAALFLSTDESAFLTGVALPVDGGVYLQ
jgi:NAD(P)-dependent dehydrogenase (short-subunit alcohol dehydrogenase family)